MHVLDVMAVYAVRYCLQVSGSTSCVKPARGSCVKSDKLSQVISPAGQLGADNCKF